MRPVIRICPGALVERGVTWYDILGVLPGASQEKIHSAYDSKAAVLFPSVCLEIAGRLELRITTIALTQHPKPVDGLVVDQSPRPPAKMRPGKGLTVRVWHPARSDSGAR